MLQRARNAGVEKIIVTAGTVREAEEAIELVNTNGMLELIITRIQRFNIITLLHHYYMI